MESFRCHFFPLHSHWCVHVLTLFHHLAIYWCISHIRARARAAPLAQVTAASITQRRWQSLANALMTYPDVRKSHMMCKTSFPYSLRGVKNAVRDWHFLFLIWLLKAGSTNGKCCQRLAARCGAALLASRLPSSSRATHVLPCALLRIVLPLPAPPISVALQARTR